MASRKQSTGRARKTTASAKKRSTQKTAARSAAASTKKSSQAVNKKTSAKKAAKKSSSKNTAKKAVTSGQKKAAATAKKKASAKTSSKRTHKKTSAKKARAAAPAKPDKARLKKQLEKERLREKKEKEREKQAEKREKERLLKEKDLEKKTAQREKERLLKEKDLEKKTAQREKERLLKDKEREKERLAKEKDKEKARKDKEREKERLVKERERLRKEKERELERVRKEKEREKERLRKEKDKERLLKEKEQEAYRKAREAERERVRSEKESARRALEGRVAQQARRAQRIAGTARGSSSRVYRPDAIPSQSGTRREGPSPGRASAAVARSMVRPSTPPPAVRAAPSAVLDERWATIQKRLKQQPERFQREYAESFDMSWIHHDSALEGVVYTYQELKTAVDPNIVIVPDSSLQPVCEEIRRHKKAIEWARELGRNDTPLGAEILKRLLILLHPEEGDLKSVKYRKEIPQHRLYFHDYAPPDKIAVRIRQAFDWLHGPEPPKLKDPVRVAARLHYDLLRTFPFPQDSGKVARLCMNVLLMRAGLPPVIVHSTERQRYYDALRGSLPTIVQMVSDSMRNAMASIEKVLDEEESEAS